MAIVSYDQVVSNIAAGRSSKFVFNKQIGAAAYTAGRWYDMATLPGLPTASTFPGAALTAVQCVSNGLTPMVGSLPLGADVEPALNRYLLSSEAVADVATGVPAWLLLVDLLLYYPGIDMNSGLQQPLTNGVLLPRYADGGGVMMYLEATATTGATPHTLHTSGFTYTNSATIPVPGRTIPGTVACTISAIVPHIVHSGVAANNFGPFIPLSTGDAGVKSVEKFQLSVASGSASTATLVLCKPLVQIPVTTLYVSSGRDFVFNMPSLPRIYDGACLTFLLFTGGATVTTHYSVSLDFVWG